MQAVLLAKMLRNFRSSAPTMAAFFDNSALATGIFIFEVNSFTLYKDD